MPDQCPQDGGFIGNSGCTHQNHRHSEHVSRLLAAARNPYELDDPADAEKALREGFYVQTRWSTRVGFGTGLLEHIDEHPGAQALDRKKKLLYAIKTVRAGKRAPNKKGGSDSYGYAMNFPSEGFGMLVLTDSHGNVEDAFTFYKTEGKARGRRK